LQWLWNTYSKLKKKIKILYLNINIVLLKFLKKDDLLYHPLNHPPLRGFNS
jgi:hypothetical protein